jgi:hypothetical protein
VGCKSGRCVGLTNFHLHVPTVLEIWEPHPPGTLRACPGLCSECFTSLQGLQTITCVALNAGRSRPTQGCIADDDYDYDEGVLNVIRSKCWCPSLERLSDVPVMHCH